MFSWLAHAMIRRNMAQVNQGNYRPMLRLDAPDIHFCFPGDSSWATEVHSRDDHGRWLQRFVDVGLQLEADEVIAQGPPWNMTLCVRGRSHLDTEDGRVYENRFVMWGRIAWVGCAAMRSTRTRRLPRNSMSTVAARGASGSAPVR
jgi:hypothetical protein